MYANCSYYMVNKPYGMLSQFTREGRWNALCDLNYIFEKNVYPVGRLDADSEGLLLLTNNGALHDALLRKEHSITKTYNVRVDKPLTPEFVTALRTGIVIMGQLTLPATVVELSNYEFSITLTQGLNRQIRRMCYKYSYEVTQLVRVGFANLTLGNLTPNEYEYVTEQAIVGEHITP